RRRHNPPAVPSSVSVAVELRRALSPGELRLASATRNAPQFPLPPLFLSARAHPSSAVQPPPSPRVPVASPSPPRSPRSPP
ncbi:hypothetical protein Zm00014a_001291, partial [Zea mays]